MKYKWSEVPLNTEIWACAYTTTSTEKHMAKKCKPVKGIVKGEFNTWGNKFFEFNRIGKLKNASVGSTSREYADTEEECMELYNSLVKKQIDKLDNLKNKCLEDLI